jgi:hypothetical protein
MRIVRNGKVAIPLYHGTSTLFLASIRKYGLGGRNPIEKLRALEFYAMLAWLCELHLREDTSWGISRILARDILRRTTRTGNWRYGGVYLTPCRHRAVTHACAYGSELITLAAALFRRLKDKGVDELRSPFFEMSKLPAFFKKPGKPLLIEIEGVRVAHLRSEDGQPPEEALAATEDIIKSFGQQALSIDGFNVPLGFETIRPINFKRLRIIRQPA